MNRMNGLAGWRRTLGASAAALALAAAWGAVAAPAAQAQTAQQQPAGALALDIQSQPLPRAIAALSAAAGVQILYTQSEPFNRQAPALKGSFTVDQALARLLAGSGLVAQRIGAGYTLAPAPKTSGDGAELLDPVNVEGRGAIGGGGSGRIVIGADELARKNPSDLRDVFAGEPGVRVGGSMAMAQKVYVNGVEETNLAVTIDGARQNNKVFHHNGTTLIDPAFLKVARVDAGVAPADAGPGALAGAIAYETKDARDFLSGDGIGGFAKTSFNSNGPSLVTSLAGYARHGGFEALGYATYGKGDEYKAGNGDKVAGTRTNILSALGKAAVETPEGHRFQFSYEAVHDDAPRPFRANIGSISGRPAWEPRVRDYVIDRRNAVFSYSQTKPSGLWDPKAVLAYSRTDVKTDIFTRPIGASTTPGKYPGSGATQSVSGKLENRFAFKLGSVTAGVDFYHDEARYTDYSYTAQEQASNIGGYFQARLEPWERLRLSFGGRGDRQRFQGTTGEQWTNGGFSHNLSGEFDLIPQHLTAKAGYSHVWAGVPLAENFILNNAWAYGNGLKPTTSDNVSIGLEGRYQGFSVDGRLFRTKMDNARAARYAVALARQSRDVESEGFEVGAGYAWSAGAAGDGFVRVKYADNDVTIDGRPADSDTGTYLATPVGRSLTIGAGHTFRQWGLTVGTDLEFVFDYDKVNPGDKPLKGYETVNLYAEYRPPSHENLSLRLDARNLFNETYADRATYGQEFGTVTPLYQPGRAVLISASAKF